MTTNKRQCLRVWGIIWRWTKDQLLNRVGDHLRVNQGPIAKWFEWPPGSQPRTNAKCLFIVIMDKYFLILTAMDLPLSLRISPLLCGFPNYTPTPFSTLVATIFLIRHKSNLLNKNTNYKCKLSSCVSTGQKKYVDPLRRRWLSSGSPRDLEALVALWLSRDLEVVVALWSLHLIWHYLAPFPNMALSNNTTLNWTIF